MATPIRRSDAWWIGSRLKIVQYVGKRSRRDLDVKPALARDLDFQPRQSLLAIDWQEQQEILAGCLSVGSEGHWSRLRRVSQQVVGAGSFGLTSASVPPPRKNSRGMSGAPFWGGASLL